MMITVILVIVTLPLIGGPVWSGVRPASGVSTAPGVSMHPCLWPASGWSVVAGPSPRLSRGSLSSPQLVPALSVTATSEPWRYSVTGTDAPLIQRPLQEARDGAVCPLQLPAFLPTFALSGRSDFYQEPLTVPLYWPLT